MNLVAVLGHPQGGRRSRRLRDRRRRGAQRLGATARDHGLGSDGFRRLALLARIDAALAGLGYRVVREQRAEAADALPDIKVFRSVLRWARFWRIENRLRLLRDALGG